MPILERDQLGTQLGNRKHIYVEMQANMTHGGRIPITTGIGARQISIHLKVISWFTPVSAIEVVKIDKTAVQ